MSAMVTATTDSNTSIMTEDNTSNCAMCDTPTTNKCGGCKSRLYCSTACQTKDWQDYNITCKDAQLEKALARVAAIAQEVFLSFRENTWDDVIKEIEGRDDALFIHDGNLMASKDWFRAFPHDIVSDNARTKMAVLTAWCCDEPYAFLHHFIAELLQGVFVVSLCSSSTLQNTGLKTDVPHGQGAC